MDKIWFIAVNDQYEGPFSIEELKRDTRITPDTLVWREGFDTWRPMRKVADLKVIFEDEKKPQPEDDEEEGEDEEEQPGKPKKKKSKAKETKPLTDEEIAINMQADFPPVLWLFLILLVITYLIYQFYA